VLPWHTSPPGTAPNAQTGYMMSGRNIAAGQTSATVIVHPFPQPTGQITVLVFEDNQSINAAYDQPAEHGLANFQFIVNDPAGQLTQDAWTYPIGTTYKYKYACTAATCVGPNVPADAGGNPLPPEQQPEYQYDAWLVFYGFVHPMNIPVNLPGPHTGTITGQVVYAHVRASPALARSEPRASGAQCLCGAE
jgi:hypothetical protein